MADITYIHLQSDFVYLAVLMDVFTRAIRGWHLARSLDHALTPTALQRALERHPAPEIHHSDQGVQYAATAYTDALQAAQIEISMGVPFPIVNVLVAQVRKSCNLGNTKGDSDYLWTG